MENIRERTCLQEDNLLSEYAQRASQSKGRKKFEKECDIRTCYQKDRDKILHSKSFRRLKQKTQVFISPEGDHYRTRLTHTLEVSQIARTIARALRLNEDLCEAIALGHDLGHTPFGHAGERALNLLAPQGFLHYEQSARVCEYLENDLKGLNLTFEVIDGIKNHTKGQLPITQEGCVVRYSDRIAYINHDIEDAITAGILSENDLPFDAVEILGHSKSERITTLITSMVENSGSEIKFSDKVEEQFLSLHRFMYRTVYVDTDAKAEEVKVDKLIQELYTYYKASPELMPIIYRTIAQNQGIDVAVCDYIQGMSDDFASRCFENIFIPRPWRIKKYNNIQYL